MSNSKSTERDQMIRGYGILMQPFEVLATQEPPPDVAEYRIAIAKNHSGDAEWRQTVRLFTTFASDIMFSQEYNDISHVPERLRHSVQDVIGNPELSNDLATLQERFILLLNDANDSFFEFVNKVPVSWSPMIFEANTPFTSYLRIKESLAVVRYRLHYFDRYLKPEFFTLFLGDLSRAMSVRLVTTKSGVNAVLAVSDLCRQEFADYELVKAEPSVLHDRNLRVDDEVFSLGPGVDRAGIALTNFGPADNSKSAHAALDEIIANGTVIHKS